MKFGKGIVKKYSREYNRTLKNGQKKKYTTQQIQITIPKNEDIYENKEEVLIIPNSEIEEFESREEEIDVLRIANYIYIEEVKKLKDQLENDSSSTLEIEKLTNALNEMEDKYNTLTELNEENEIIKDKHSKLISENENLKSKFVNLKTENENLKTKYTSMKEENQNLKNKCSALKEEHSSIRESYEQVSIKYDNLKQENLNTKTSYAELYEINEDLEKDYDTLLGEYNDLVDKFNTIQDELYALKTQQSQDEVLANRVKEFMFNRI